MDHDGWTTSMHTEFTNHQKPRHRNLVKLIWVYKTKRDGTKNEKVQVMCPRMHTDSRRRFRPDLQRRGQASHAIFVSPPPRLHRCSTGTSSTTFRLRSGLPRGRKSYVIQPHVQPSGLRRSSAQAMRDASFSQGAMTMGTNDSHAHSYGARAARRSKHWPGLKAPDIDFKT